MKRPVGAIADVRHGKKLCYSQDRMCAHPRQCPIGNFGNGEITVIHHHAPCAYAARTDVGHGMSGYKGRAKIFLQRSLDHGETWPSKHEVVIWDDSLPLDEKRAILGVADHDVSRETIDLSSSDALVYFARPATGPRGTEGDPTIECFAFRSADRGRTWERVPTRVSPPSRMNYVHVDGAPPVKFDDATQLVVASCGPSPFTSALVVYGTDDNGLVWKPIAEIARDPTGLGRPTYGALLLLPTGRLQCYMLNIGGIHNAIQMCHSDDGGYSWSFPQPIVAWGQSPWTTLTRDHAWPGARRNGPLYRSPWPLLLRDGRIVVIFGRRHPPFGIGLIVSDDDGETWSAEAVIRADASDWDIGYPVATELDDGRIFTAYYYMQDDGNGLGGTRHIASSVFRLTS